MNRVLMYNVRVRRRELAVCGVVSMGPDRGVGNAGSEKPTGVDYFASDDRFASGTEIAGEPQVVDWLTHADQGVRFAYLKARHAEFVGGHSP
jgi:hypothetical protein